MNNNPTDLHALRYADIEDVIAELQFEVLFPDKRKEAQIISIGRPFCIDTLFVCQAKGTGPITLPPFAAGDNSFQALLLILITTKKTIKNFIEETKSTFLYGGSEMPTDEFIKAFFGNI